MSFSSEHHSFDIKLATMFGIEEAILIHHFQYWIRINKAGNKNLRDGRTWTYQTRRDIKNQFPYWNVDRVKYLCEKLVGMGVLVTANYNKSAVDKTLWYAFSDEQSFVADIVNSNNPYERQKCPSKGKSALPEGKSASPIPDTIPDSISHMKKEAVQNTSAEADSLCTYFLKKLKERNPNFKAPNMKAWNKQMDLMLRIDARASESVKAAIDWISEDQWYKANCLSPESLRKAFDKIIMKMEAELEVTNIKANRNFAISIKERFPEEMKSMSFDTKFVSNRSTGQDVSLNLPELSFRTALFEIFGGGYAPKTE